MKGIPVTYLLSGAKRVVYCFVTTGSLCVLSFNLDAQQEWGYTQYLFNLYDINSAYAGNHGAGSFGVRYRSQWIGMVGAPETQYISFHSPLAGEKAGLGVKVLNENIGARSLTSAKVSGAYKVRFNQATLSFGLAGGIIRQGVDATSIKAFDQNDVQLQNLPAQTLTPTIDASVFFNTNRFYAGIESGNINRSKTSATEHSLSRLYYSVTTVCGYIHPLKHGSKVQLSGLMRLTENNLWQAELNALYLVKSRLWFGGGYRFDSNAQVMACVSFSEQLRIGLSYDVSTTAIRKLNDGSAEVFLGFNFKNKSGKSIRYF